jgi:hypothetical protein
MATRILPNHAFLVFPTSNPVYSWRVAAEATNRTISLHKNLSGAVSKAAKLNDPTDPFFSRILEVVDKHFKIPKRQPKVPDLVRCAWEDHWGEAEGLPCNNLGTIFDPKTELEWCPEHYAEILKEDRRG